MTAKYKSKFEASVARDAPKLIYEPDKLAYEVPIQKRTYLPDFKVAEGVYIECKGILDLDTRKKMVLVKEQYPQYTFYLLFQNANNRLYRGSKTTYGDWATANGFEWACYKTEGLPKRWLKKRRGK